MEDWKLELYIPSICLFGRLYLALMMIHQPVAMGVNPIRHPIHQLKASLQTGAHPAPTSLDAAWASPLKGIQGFQSLILGSFLKLPSWFYFFLCMVFSRSVLFGFYFFHCFFIYSIFLFFKCTNFSI